MTDERSPGHRHLHGHAHAAGLEFGGRLLLILGLTSVVFVVQIVGGLASGSLALLADAGHVLADMAGLLLSLFALKFAARPATDQRTFGYLRMEALAAFGNAALLLVLGGWVTIESVRRLSNPPAVEGGLMLTVALIGMAVNALGLLLLQSGKDKNLALRGAYLEVLGDLFGSAGVVIAAVVVTTTGQRIADPIAGLLVGALVLPRAYALLSEAVHVLLESTPKGMDLEEIRGHLLGVAHVRAVHDVHAWSLGTGAPVLSAHVVVDQECFLGGHTAEVLAALQQCLAGHFDVGHSTFQLEPEGHSEQEHASHA